MASCSTPLDDDVRRDDDGYKAKEISLEAALQSDANDESLNKWKEALLAEAGNIGGQRVVTLTSFSLVFANGDPEITIPLNDPAALEKLASSPIELKENVQFRYRVVFNVGGDILSGLTFLASVYRLKIRVMKQQYMLGSYAPRTSDHEVVFPQGFDEWLVTPSGFTGRGTYNTRVLFTDDDSQRHFDFSFSFKVVS
ncbi:hypothetical protein RCL1_001670 [Eukaryota sp. TZLM3-RCL]